MKRWLIINFVLFLLLTSGCTKKINRFVENHNNIPLPNEAIFKNYSPYKPETSTFAGCDEKFTYEVDLTQEKLMKFYKENLPKYGWKTYYIAENLISFKSSRELLTIGIDKKTQNKSILIIMIGE